MNSDEKQTRSLSKIAIFLSIFIIIPSVSLLLGMLTGNGKDMQYGYSMYVVLLIVLGAIPTLLSIILGIMAFSIYHKNKKSCRKVKKLALFALLLPIINVLLIIIDLLLDAIIV